MTNLNDQSNLFEGMTLSELCEYELYLDDLRMYAYAPLGAIEEDEFATDEQLAYAKSEESRLNKIFRTIENDWERAVELASYREDDGHFA